MTRAKARLAAATSSATAPGSSPGAGTIVARPSGTAIAVAPVPASCGAMVGMNPPGATVPR